MNTFIHLLKAIFTAFFFISALYGKDRLLVAEINISEHVKTLLEKQNMSVEYLGAKGSGTKTSYNAEETSADQLSIFTASLRDHIENSIMQTGIFEAVPMSGSYPVLNNEADLKTVNISEPNIDYILSVAIGNFTDNLVNIGMDGNGENIKKRIMEVSGIVSIYDVKAKRKVHSENISVSEDMTDVNLQSAGTNSVMAGDLVSKLMNSFARKIVGVANGSLNAPKFEILKVDGEEVITSISKLHGAKAGDIFDVFKEGEEIIDGSGRSLGRMSEKVGQIEITDVFDDAEFSKGCVLEGAEKISKGNILKKPKLSDSDLAKSAVRSKNESKYILQRVINTRNDMVDAKKKIAEAEKMIKEGHRLAEKRDYVIGAGTTLEKYVSADSDRELGRRMVEKGEALKAEGEKIQAEIGELYRTCSSIFDKEELKSKKGSSVIGIVLKYERNEVYMLIKDKVYQFNDNILDAASRTKLRIYKE